MHGNQESTTKSPQRDNIEIQIKDEVIIDNFITYNENEVLDQTEASKLNYKYNQKII